MNIYHTILTMSFTAPTAPQEANKYMPPQTENFAEGLLYVIKSAIGDLNPSIRNAASICISLIAVVMLLTLLQSFTEKTSQMVRLTGSVAIGIILLGPSTTLIHLGIETITKISDYEKLFLPVMTAALAAQGGITSSTALYTGTAFFNAILSSMIRKVFSPLIYFYLITSVANSAIGNSKLQGIAKFIKWIMTWFLKIIMYIFTGYISITGIVSGAVDASAIKATKLAISGAVPVVGGIMSDASEAILVSAGVMKNAAGIFGLLAVLALWIGPFLNIAIQYLLLKATAAICSAFGEKESVSLIQSFAGAMGLLLAATGVMCLLFIISTVCFMRGMT